MVTQNGITATVDNTGLLTVSSTGSANGTMPVTATATSVSAPTVKGSTSASIAVLNVEYPNMDFTEASAYSYDNDLASSSYKAGDEIVVSGKYDMRAKGSLRIGAPECSDVTLTVPMSSDGSFAAALYPQSFVNNGYIELDNVTNYSVTNLSVKIIHAGGSVASKTERLSGRFDSTANRLYFDLPSRITAATISGATFYSTLQLSSGWREGTTLHNTVTDCTVNTGSSTGDGYYPFTVTIPIVNSGVNMDAFLKVENMNCMKNVVCTVTVPSV